MYRRCPNSTSSGPGFVCSDPLDHTSALRFIERVTGISEPNISDWRRSTFSDFAGAFRTSAAPAPSIPAASASATSSELSYQTQQSKLPLLPVFPGATHTPPTQQAGHRPSAS